MSAFSKCSLAACLALVCVTIAGDGVGEPQTKRHQKRRARTQRVDFTCRVESNNDGCEKRIACPPGSEALRAVAACNLEYGPVTRAQLAGVPMGRLRVTTPSDYVEEGSCWVQGSRLVRGSRAIESLAGLASVTVGCQEHDQNGGDCEIRGTLLCRARVERDGGRRH